MRETEVIKVKPGIPILLSCACLAASAAVAAAEEVDRRLDAAPNGHVDIYNTAGSIEVYGWSNDSVEVTGELGDNVEELILERDDDRVLVKVKVSRDSKSRISSDITVRVPGMSSIDVSAVSADISVEGVKGVQGLHSVSGDVSTRAYAADVGVGSVSGDVSVEGKGKKIETKASTVSGDITLYDLGGEVEAEAVSGDITIDDGSFDRVSIEAVSGDIVFQAELRAGGRFGAETVNGDVEVEFDGQVAARFDVQTFNGEIDNCFGPKPQRTSKYAPGLELRFTQDDGEGSVTISTLNGGISICTK
jgi:DUF4097 and DUF4098 domain-containing protein YvlB